MSEPAASARPRRADVQGLRGVAVLLVVAYHLDLGVHGGYLGVDVFFVISGYVIARLLGGELHDTARIDLRAFYARRARRLLPALAVMVTVVSVLGMLVLSPFETLPFAVRTGAAALGFVANVHLYRHVGYFDSTAETNPFLHTWSLSIEEQFYLVFPWVLIGGAALAARRDGRRSEPPSGLRPGRSAAAERWTLTGIVAGVGAVSLVGAWLMTSGRVDLGLDAAPRLAYFAAPTRAWEFCAGALVAVWPRREGSGVAGRSLPTTLAAVAGVALVVIAVASVGATEPFTATLALAVVTGTVSVLAAGESAGRSGDPATPVIAPNPVTAALSLRPLTFVGDVSYAWYLWHWPAIVMARVWWPEVDAAAPLAVLGSFGVAVASTRWLEGPMRRAPLPRPRLVRAAVAFAVVPVLVVGVVWVGTDRGLGVEVPAGWYDFPEAGAAGCALFNRDIANEWPEAACRTDVAASTGTVVVLGDLSADSVSTAVVEAASERRLDTAVWVRDGCPFLGRSPVDFPACEAWNDDALAVVDRLDAELVVVSNRSPAYVDPASDLVVADGQGDAPATREVALAAWRAGFTTLLDELGRRGVAVIVVGPVPEYGSSFGRDRVSVLRPDVVVPTRTRAQVADARADVVGVERQVAEGRRSVRWIDPVPILCADECRPVSDGQWWYHAPEYLNRAGARQLVPVVRQAIDEVLAEE